jgi:uncharacterized repeat protein (TIGR01451 family)
MRFISPRPRSLWLACLCFAGAAWAQSAPVSSQLQVEQVETLDGQTVLHPVQTSRPGDVLEYRVSYTNHSAAAVQGLIASLPIPAGTTLIDGSQLPPNALASTDGTSFAPLPLLHRVRQADGSERLVPVPLADYRALRWNLGPLAAGTTREVSARVRVNTTTPAVAAAAAPPRG